MVVISRYRCGLRNRWSLLTVWVVEGDLCFWGSGKREEKVSQEIRNQVSIYSRYLVGTIGLYLALVTYRGALCGSNICRLSTVDSLHEG